MAESIKQEEYLKRVGEGIKELRLNAGFTSAETFANEYNLNRVQYWRVEKGANITLKTLLNILSLHNLSPSVFFNQLDKNDTP